VGRAFVNAFNRMEDTLVEFILRGKLDFKGFVDSILADIVRIQIQQQISAPLAAFIGGLFGGGKALGGPVSGGNAYVVGERGPELFVPRASGAIVPNDRLGGGGTFYIDARGADPAGLMRLEKIIAGLDGSIEYRAVAAVANEALRGGRYASAFAP